MAAQRITTKQKHIHTKHNRAYADAEVVKRAIAIVVEKESAVGVIGQEKQKQNRKIQKVPVDVLQN